MAENVCERGLIVRLLNERASKMAENPVIYADYAGKVLVSSTTEDRCYPLAGFSDS